MNRTGATAAALSLLLLCSCAWTRRENRPVWNAFEANLVPASRGWFVATLPFTVVAGLGAILADTLVVHPLQVVDDAWLDAGRLWRDGRPDFTDRYYSEMAFLPVRAALTPVVFAGSFLGRSMLDIRSDEEREAERQEQRRQAQERAAAQLRRWLARLRAGGGAPLGAAPPEAMDAELAADVRQTLAVANGLGRLQIYRLSLRRGSLTGVVDPVDGLRDPDPVVRFELLEWLPRETVVPADLVRALRADAVDSVAARARQRWPD